MLVKSWYMCVLFALTCPRSLLTLTFMFFSLRSPAFSSSVLDTTSATSTSVMSPVSYTHLRAHETRHDLVCRLLLEKKKKQKKKKHKINNQKKNQQKKKQKNKKK